MEFKAKPRIIAEVVMLSEAEGGRSHGIQIGEDARYMPHLVAEERSNRSAKTGSQVSPPEHYMSVLFEPPELLTNPLTGSGVYPLRLLGYPDVDYQALVINATFTVREGKRIVGHGIVTARES